MVKLTSGALHAIMSEENIEKPVLQVLSYKKIGMGGERYRLQVSDGQFCHTFAMLATQLNHLINEGKLESNTVVQVDRYLRNKVKSGDGGFKEVLVLLELTVMSPGSEVGTKIGNPVPYTPTAAAAANTTTTTNGSDAPATNTSAQARSGFANNIPQRSPQKPASSMGGGAVHTHPISSLTPYQNKWTIRARVTNKTSIKHWSNSRGEGKLFSMDLLDESGEIRATAFNQHVDKFYQQLEVGKVYFISRCTLKTANKNFTSIKNDYEMTFNDGTQVQPCYEASDDLPSLTFNFVEISDLEKVNPNAIVDVIGVCKGYSETQRITARATNKELTKRELEIVDMNNVGVTLTLWAEQAESFQPDGTPVVAIKGARVSDFNGRSLSTVSSSQVQVDPDIKEAHALRGWYDSEGAKKATTSITQKSGGGGAGPSNTLTFAEAKIQNLGFEKADYYTIKATIVMLRHENALYQACPSEGCNKKVTDLNNGMYRCEKCNKEYTEFNWRLILSMNLADMTDYSWVTCFQEGAESLLGVSANEVGQAKQEDSNQYLQIFQNSNFKQAIFKLRVKTDTYNDETRLKTTVVTVSPLDYAEYNKKLLAQVKEIMANS